ncbi:MAG: hypothetical protein ACI9J3_002723, partial [Parvicellaceae bacterium]
FSKSHRLIKASGFEESPKTKNYVTSKISQYDSAKFFKPF